MSHSNAFQTVLHLLRQILVAAIKLVAIIVAWCIKGTGHIFISIGEFITKNVEK